MNRSRTAFALGLVVPLLVVGGCSSDEPEPRIAPSESPSPTSSPPTQEALDPVQTVRAWVEAQNTALTTGDTAELKELSADPCEACDQFIEPIEHVYRDGGRYITRGWSVEAAKVRSAAARPIVVDTAISIAGGKTILKQNGEPVIYETEKHIMVFKLAPDGQGWAVSFIGFIS